MAEQRLGKRGNIVLDTSDPNTDPFGRSRCRQLATSGASAGGEFSSSLFIRICRLFVPHDAREQKSSSSSSWLTADKELAKSRFAISTRPPVSAPDPDPIISIAL